MDKKTMRCPCGCARVTAKQSGRGSQWYAPSDGQQQKYVDCCGRYLDDGEAAPTAEALMRSRYAAYTLGCEDYLLTTWHHSTRPASLELANEPHRNWLGLEVRRHEQLEPDHAMVEFVARSKVGGRAHRLHEISRFVREAGQWFYLDGDIVEGGRLKTAKPVGR